MRGRVTIRFGSLRVVVPCGEEGMTVRELGEQALLRYKRATAQTDAHLHIISLRCESDDGILDPDDRVADVFDHTQDQILAIYDEQTPSSGGEVDGERRRSPVLGRARHSVVEISDIHNPPSIGLHVASTPHRNQPLPPPPVVGQSVRSSLRQDTTRASTHSSATKRSVTLSPEVEKKLQLEEAGQSSSAPPTATPPTSHLIRSSARKSRLTDNFFDAKERLEFCRSSVHLGCATPRQLPLLPARDGAATLVQLENAHENPIGIEVTGVSEVDSTRLNAVQIIRIDPEGRVAADGRIRVGDNLIEINGRPVYQMSLLRVRAYLQELQSRPRVSLTVDRPMSAFAPPTETTPTPQQQRPILSALQQANTKSLGATLTVNIVKKSDGFGFTVTGRQTASGHLFLIGKVNLNGAGHGKLKAGDKLLEINGESTSGLRQSDVVDRLKKTPPAAEVTLLVSRVVDEADSTPSGPSPSAMTASIVSTASGVENQPPDASTIRAEEAPVLVPLTPSPTRFREIVLDIPLNDTGSAGLGLSIKARVLRKSDDSRIDCGIFVKKLLHGGAAWKDGRLCVDDQLVGIESVDLRTLPSNAAQSEAITVTLKHIGPTASTVRLHVLREMSAGAIGCVRETVDGPDSTIVLGGASPVKRREATEEGGHDDYRMSVVDADSCMDAFDREAPGRKSMSEKRHLGADPVTSLTYQRIVHHRHTSAPLSSLSTSASFHGVSHRSASQRAKERARSSSVHSSSVHPRTPRYRPEEKEQEQGQEQAAQDDRQRSLSVENAHRIDNDGFANSSSLAAILSSPLSPTIPDGVKKVARGKATNQSFKIAMDETGVQLFSPGAASLRDEEKKQRRKSMGGGLMSFFKLGSGRSRDGSPEKAVAEASRRREEEERARIQHHYERMRAEQRMAQSVPGPEWMMGGAGMGGVPLPPPINVQMRRQPQQHRVYTEWQPTQTQPSTTDDYFRVANSRFFDCPPSGASRLLSPGRKEKFSRDTNNTATDHPHPILEGSRSLRPAPPPPTTTMPSTRGSLTAVEGPWQRPQQPSRPSRRLSAESPLPRATGPAPPPQATLPAAASARPSSTLLPSSTHRQPIAFPTTRVAFATPLLTHSSDRLSMRARKKLHQSVVAESCVDEPPSFAAPPLPLAPSPPAPPPRRETTIDDPGVSVYPAGRGRRKWYGGSLPARRPRHRAGIDRLWQPATDL